MAAGVAHENRLYARGQARDPGLGHAEEGRGTETDLLAGMCVDRVRVIAGHVGVRKRVVRLMMSREAGVCALCGGLR